MKVEKIYFIPFAGGSKYSYSAFTSRKNNNFTIVPVDLPGRGSRITEDLIPNIYQLADDLYDMIKRTTQPFAIFGHSMGAILTYLVAKKLAKGNYRLPSYLFFSGCPAPSLYKKDDVHSLPNDLFFDFIKKLDDTQNQIFSNPEIIDFIEPILRSDFRALSKFKYERNDRWNIPISVMIGNDENITLSEANAWKEETTEDFHLHILSGQHFFIYHNVDNILNIITESLRKRSLL